MGDRISELTHHRGVLIIGEVGQAHDGSLGTAHAYIDAIADAGADAVKFQTHIAEAESSPDEPWRVKFSLQDRSRYDYWQRMQFTVEQWRELKQHVESRGLLFLSSPFSHEAVSMLMSIGVRAWKVASGETTNHPLLGELVKSDLPIIASTGMSDLQELDDLVRLLESSRSEYALLQCSSTYPTPPQKVGLNVMAQLRDRYGCKVGISDHSGTIFPAIAAATLGASVIEVHVTLSRKSFGPDVASSVTDDELATLVNGVRFVENALSAPVDKTRLSDDLANTKKIFGRSVVAARDLEAGRLLADGDLVLKKPGIGLGPEHLPRLFGRRLRRGLSRNERLSEGDVD